MKEHTSNERIVKVINHLVFRQLLRLDRLVSRGSAGPGAGVRGRPTQPPPAGSWWVAYRRTNRRLEEKAAGSRWFAPRAERPSGRLKPPTDNQIEQACNCTDHANGMPVGCGLCAVGSVGVECLLATTPAATQPQTRVPVERLQDLGGFSGLRCAGL